MTTMKDIARESGTSQATVSRILSGNPAVNPEVKARVLECIKKHNYKPNIIAQSLTGSRSMLIGALIPDISNPFFADLIKAIENEASKYGYSLILCNTNGDLEKEKKYIQILHRYRVEGIIMVPRNIENSFFLSLSKSETPIVISTMLVPGFSCVSVSHMNAGSAVAQHFFINGYSHFIFLGNSNDEKEVGFLEELKKLHVNIKENYNFIDLSAKGTVGEKLFPFLKIKNLGIFAMNDIIALLVLDILKENDVKIPEEIALVGFDNTFISKEVSPSFTSVSQPIDEIGRISVETLLSKILTKQNQNETFTDTHITLETRLIPRGSTIKMTKTTIS